MNLAGINRFESTFLNQLSKLAGHQNFTKGVEVVLDLIVKSASEKIDDRIFNRLRQSLNVTLASCTSEQQKTSIHQ